MTQLQVSPTQELIMNVLVARYRLDETLWTFDATTRAQALGLQDKGLINVTHGIVPKTYRASLTDEGKATYMSDSYVPPNNVNTSSMSVTVYIDGEKLTGIVKK